MKSLFDTRDSVRSDLLLVILLYQHVRCCTSHSTRAEAMKLVTVVCSLHSAKPKAMNAVLEIDCRQNDTALHKRYSTTSSGLNVTDQCREMTSASARY